MEQQGSASLEEIIRQDLGETSVKRTNCDDDGPELWVSVKFAPDYSYSQVQKYFEETWSRNSEIDSNNDFYLVDDKFTYYFDLNEFEETEEGVLIHGWLSLANP